MTAVALLLAALAYAAPAPAAPKGPEIVSIKTNDGWTLAADYLRPRKGGVVIVLAHGVGSSRGEWPKLTERLKTEGIGTLAIDLRGHHDSLKGPKGSGDFTTFDATHEWPKAVEDMLAAARWLKARGVKEDHIAFGGASIGANLAAQAAAQSPNAPFLLLFSPGPDYRGVELKMRRGLKTLAGATPADAYAYQTMGPLSKLDGVEVFEAPAGHGVQMFDDKATLDKIVAWVVATAKTKK
jgi:dienelactone hydrolase